MYNKVIQCFPTFSRPPKSMSIYIIRLYIQKQESCFHKYRQFSSFSSPQKFASFANKVCAMLLPGISHCLHYHFHWKWMGGNILSTAPPWKKSKGETLLLKIFWKSICAVTHLEFWEVVSLNDSQAVFPSNCQANLSELEIKCFHLVCLA